MNDRTAATPASARPAIPRARLIALAVLAVLGYAVLTHLPFETIERNQIGIRSNRLTGSASVVGAGYAVVLPGLHALRRFPLADQVHQLQSDEEANAVLKSSEGMPLSARIDLRYAVALRPSAKQYAELPEDLDGELIAPLVREVVARQFASRTVLAIVAEQHQQLPEAIESELRSALAVRGLRFRKLQLEEIKLPEAFADRVYNPERSVRANGPAPLQTSEGLAIGAEISIRYALDPQQLRMLLSRPGGPMNQALIEPLVQGVIYKQFSHYTVREILTGKRQELKEAIETELQPLMIKDGLIMRSVTIGNVDLPADFRAGMDRLLAAELATQQMERTLELKAKQVRETELQGEADKMRREKAAEAAANEQVIAAKAQEEAMKHVLPFKQKQLEQRRLESAADKASRIAAAEASADARRIEAAAEADSRRKLADADAYRIEQLGKLSTSQLERDGALIARYPLLIQKTMADKLSDKISVIIAPPPGDGGFVGNTLLGAAATTHRREQP